MLPKEGLSQSQPNPETKLPPLNKLPPLKPVGDTFEDQKNSLNAKITEQQNNIHTDTKDNMLQLAATLSTLSELSI